MLLLAMSEADKLANLSVGFKEIPKAKAKLSRKSQSFHTIKLKYFNGILVENYDN